MKSAIAIIPARFASTRFPGKPLEMIHGKPMIQRVYEQAQKSNLLSEIWVATDDQRIVDVVSGFGGRVAMTSPDCPSGTDRCAELMQSMGLKAEIVLNIQGDEPFIRPEQIDQLVNLMQNPEVQMATLCKKITRSEELFNPNVVKLVKTTEGKALYFSRNPIPFFRGESESNWLEKTAYFKHLGVYAYRANVLFDITHMSVSQLEKAESLEQLRWLEGGYAIGVGETEWESLGIDTPEDLAWASAHWNEISSQ